MQQVNLLQRGGSGRSDQAMSNQIINTVIDGKYQILSLLAEGGNGSVYKAYQPDLTRFVAIKMMRQVNALDSESRQRFEREGAYLARLAHENIVKTYAIGFLDDDSLYLALEFLEGKTLAKIAQDSGGIPLTRLLKLGIQVCKAVEFAHSQGIIHRDLKSQNIMVLDFPDREIVKVLDFGLSKLICPDAGEAQKLTRTGDLIGSVHYMSPETCFGKQADFRTDIYSLGCVLYECAFGSPPFQADNPLSVMYKQKNEYPASLMKSALSPLELVILKCLQKDPAQRFASAGELCHALELIADGRAKELSLGDIGRTMIVGSPKKNSLWVALLLLFLLVLSGLVFTFMKRNTSHETGHDAPRVALKSATEKHVERDLKNSLARAEKNFAPDSPEIEERVAKLGLYYMEQGRLPEAEQLLRRSLAMKEKELGPKDTMLFWKFIYLADCLNNQGRFVEATPLYERALAVRNLDLGPMDIDVDLERTLSGRKRGEEKSTDPQIDRTRRLLADCYSKQKRYTEAEHALESAVAIKERVSGVDSPDIPRDFCRLAGWYREQGNYDKAEQLYKRAIDSWEKTAEPNAADMALGLRSYAGLLRELKRNAEADKLETRAKALNAG